MLELDAVHRKNCLALIKAAKDGDIKAVQLLLTGGNVNINFKDGSKRTALHWAAYCTYYVYIYHM